jgi:succinate dehydrogenase hydrophobic anchor subunit
MTDTSLPMQSTYAERLMRPRTDWGAIWGGAFIFVAIWAVFESLALAIFGVPAAMAGTGAGMAIWTIILTIIAMYVAGVETGRLGGVGTRRDGLVHGMMMFGLSTVSAVVLISLTSAVLSYGAGAMASAHSMWTNGLTSAMEWTVFLSLFLGWLAAMGGASSGMQRKSMETRQTVPMRPAA